MALNTDEETWRKLEKLLYFKTCYNSLNRAKISTLEKIGCDLILLVAYHQANCNKICSYKRCS